MGAVDAGPAVEDLHAGPGAERGPSLGLHAGPGEAEDLGNRRTEVVVADFSAWQPSQHLESVEVALEEGFLSLRDEDAVDGLSGEGEPEDEQIAQGAHAVQGDVDIAE